jgi:hypothetical protein
MQNYLTKKPLLTSICALLLSTSVNSAPTMYTNVLNSIDMSVEPVKCSSDGTSDCLQFMFYVKNIDVSGCVTPPGCMRFGLFFSDETVTVGGN